ncbi:MAG: hypothetical protein ACHQ2E_09470 [Gemmatimonadales bacterium]
MALSYPGRGPGDPQPAPGEVGVAARSLAFAVLFGTGLIAIALWGVRTMQLDNPVPPTPGTFGPTGVILAAATLGGPLAAAAAAFALMAPIGSYYRRGGLAMVGGFATVVVALVTMPVDQRFGRPGLLALAALCAVSCLLLALRARRASALHS